jgi:hypothetical protein
MYKIIGIDGRQYGPISADQLRRWIAEGRANVQTQTFVEGASEWKPLGALPEFAVHFAPQVPPQITPVTGSHVRRTNALALWGMILGILALVFCICCCLNIPLGALGLVFSLCGLFQINERPEYYEGRGLAIAGIVLSSLALLISILMLLSNAASGNYHPYYNWHYQRY